MNSDLLINYVSEHLNAVEKHLLAYREDREPERIHLLRVEIKKIKAVFSLFESIHNEKYTDNRLISLFHKAGEIREIEISLLLLVALPGLPERFILKLEEEKRKRKELFEKNIPGYIKHVRNTRERINLPQELIHKRSIIKYFKTEIHKLRKKMTSEDREEMHRLRMSLKKLIYLYDALPEKIQHDLRLNTGFINKLQKEAGDWHDIYSTINFLSRQQEYGKIAEYIYDLQEKEKKQFTLLIKKLNEQDFWKN